MRVVKATKMGTQCLRVYLGHSVSGGIFIHATLRTWNLVNFPFDWLIVHVDVVRRLWPKATNGPVDHSPGNIWAWRTVVKWYRQGKTPDSYTLALWQPLEQWYSTGFTRRHLRGYVDYTICTNNFGGTKLKRNYIWGYANKKGWIPLP
jgi:hypothetical protein